MKYVKQLTIILAISFAGELLNRLIPLPVPASVYGFVIMLVCLLTGVIKLYHVEETGRLLIDIMPIMFIPAAVGLIDSWGILSPVWLPVTAVTVITTAVVMVVSGRVTQALIRFKRRREGDKNA